MAAAVYLYVDRPVASLQLDIQTTGQAISLIDPSRQKYFRTGRRLDGKLRIVVFGFGQQSFAGKFASVDASVTGISGVMSANSDSSDAEALVFMLSKIAGLKVICRKTPDGSEGESANAECDHYAPEVRETEVAVK
jgi:hypothetical protein